jgi:hypothetical protein
MVFYYGGPISWSATKTKTATSTCEAEYIAMWSCTKEILYWRQLFKEMNIMSEGPTILMEDNQGAIYVAYNPVNHNKLKHVDVQFNATRHAIYSGDIEVHYCPTKLMLADILTKALAKPTFEVLRDQIVGVL